ncbi:MAG: glycosyltransferase family 39 protein, partial [Anaerolineales bacterium]
MGLALPFAVFVFSLLTLHGRDTSRKSIPHASFRHSLLKALVSLGTTSLVIIELLGIAKAISGPSVTLAWLIVLFAWLTVGLRTGHLLDGFNAVRKAKMPTSWAVRGVIGAMSLVAALLLFLAWISASNNVDSLLYHLPRVAYWTQSGSLQHYAANYHHQLSMPIWAETAILQFRVLVGTDDLSNLVQWAGMAGSVLGVSAIAALMRGSTWTQLVAAAYAISIPMGVLQATSTQNDHVVSLWMVCLAYFIVYEVTQKGRSSEWMYVGLALGLGLLTKATAYVYALPFLTWFLAASIRNLGAGRALRTSVFVAALAVLLNLGYWSRNMTTYSTPFGPSVFVQRALSFVPKTLDMESAESSNDLGSSDGGFLRRTTTAMARNLMTPHTGINRAVTARISETGIVLPEYEEQMAHAIWNFEDTAGNPLHLLAVPVSIALLAVAAWKRLLDGGSWIWIYLACAGAGYLLLANVISNGASVFGLRFQLTFFILWAPLVGMSMLASGNRYLSVLGAATYLLAAIPWVVLNNTRPLTTFNESTTRIESVLTASESEVMFAMAPHLRDEYTQLGSIVTSSECKEVGYRI